MKKSYMEQPVIKSSSRKKKKTRNFGVPIKHITAAEI